MRRYALRKSGVANSTLVRWLEDPEFAQAWAVAKESAAENVENLLWDFALGKVKVTKGCAPPNVTAVIFLAKGYMPEKYREKVEDRVQVDVVFKGYAGFDPAEAFGSGPPAEGLPADRISSSSLEA